jgi:hypothetical protein
MNRNQLIGLFSILILIGALSRLIPHAWNFTPIAAIALFAGFFYQRKAFSVAIPVVVLLVSDGLLFLMRNDYPFLHNSPAFLFQRVFDYSAMAGVALLGVTLPQNLKWPRVIGYSLAGSFGFFLVSNFACWCAGQLFTAGTPFYPATFDGLLTCYSMGIPFYRGTLYGDLLYTVLLFGAYYVLKPAAQPNLDLDLSQ